MNLQDIVIAELLRPHEEPGLGGTLVMIAIGGGALFAWATFEYALGAAAHRIFRAVRKAWKAADGAPPPS